MLYSHIEALHIRPDPEEVRRQSANSYYSLWMGAEPDAAESGARHVFEHWAIRHGIELGDSAMGHASSATVGWKERIGSPETVLARHGRFADLVVIERPEARIAWLEATLFRAGRPALLCPPRPPERLGHGALIAWNGSPEALHAIKGAMPFLRHMRRVLVLSVGGERAGDPSLLSGDPSQCEELAGYLACHGVPAERASVPGQNGDVAGQILAEARRIAADLIVMGAYSHSRLREAILGGTTRSVIENADLPVLLAH
jgi:nucleotide-binding universal stress UspA family protein